MSALSFLDGVRTAPSAAESFLVMLGCILSRTCGKKNGKVQSSPYHLLRRFGSTFCESLIPGVESSFLGLANIEVTDNHTQGSRVARPMHINTA